MKFPFLTEPVPTDIPDVYLRPDYVTPEKIRGGDRALAVDILKRGFCGPPPECESIEVPEKMGAANVRFVIRQYMRALDNVGKPGQTPPAGASS